LKTEPLEIFRKFVPHEAAPYCLRLYEFYGFEFKIKKSRETKLGDYRYEPKDGKHVITINNDLNPYAFLITYLHEVAHLVTVKTYRNKVQPHGEEWKHNFKRVAQPMLNLQVFPENILTIFSRYLKNPKASSCSDPQLYQVLRLFDAPNGKVMLKTLKPGNTFLFRNKEFEYLDKRKTRILVMDKKNRKKYLIAGVAEVNPLDN
jgi:hypothetical protein